MLPTWYIRQPTKSDAFGVNLCWFAKFYKEIWYYHFLIMLDYLLNGIIQVSECFTSLELLLITAGSSECALVNLRVA